MLCYQGHARLKLHCKFIKCCPDSPLLVTLEHLYRFVVLYLKLE